MQKWKRKQQTELQAKKSKKNQSPIKETSKPVNRNNKQLKNKITKHHATLKEKQYTHTTIIINFNDYNLNHEYLLEIILVASYDNNPYLKRDTLPTTFYSSFIPEYVE